MTIAARSHYLGKTVGTGQTRADRSRALELRVFQLEKYLATQHEITQIIARASELDTALPCILQAICETTDWDFGEVWQIDPLDNRMHCIAIWRLPECNFPVFEKSGAQMTFESGCGLPGRVWHSGKPAWVANVIFDSNFMRAGIAEQDGLHGGLGIPIRADSRVIGAMTFFSRQPRQLDRNLLNVLDTVGSQIGLFIESKRAEEAEHQQARIVAAMEERQRLARDLHDSVTQSLFSASVIAEMLPMLWERKPEQVLDNLSELHHLTRDALSEMRALLVELRPPTLAHGDLSELLRGLADTLKNRANLHVILETHVANRLSADEQIALYRITQEALNNITKHAEASLVSICLTVEGRYIKLTIEDDGNGFDSRRVPANHFGLEVMTERAAGIGASLIIESAIGCGTRLSILRGG